MRDLGPDVGSGAFVFRLREDSDLESTCAAESAFVKPHIVSVLVVLEDGSPDFLVVVVPQLKVKQLFNREGHRVNEVRGEVELGVADVQHQVLAVAHGPDDTLADLLNDVFVLLPAEGDQEAKLVQINHCARVVEEGGRVAVLVVDEAVLALVFCQFDLSLQLFEADRL